MAEPRLQPAPAPAPAEDLTGKTVGRFAVRARLGAGGMGEVYRADDPALKRPVALKRMAPHLRTDDLFRRRFLREAERASQLNHPHVAAIYDVLEQDGEAFLVMEYVEGENLRSRLRRPIPLDEFLPLATQCAAALAAAHEKGVVHRDIKPENIMLTPAGQVKVLDFGVARLLPRFRAEATTESGTAALTGTPAYMAPEVLLEKEPDHRSDLFSLGVVLYEALTGVHPFRADTFVATLDRILHADPPPPSRFNPAVPPALDRIVLRLLARDPEARYPSAAALLADLEALAAGRAPALALPRRPWRTVVLAAVALLLVLLLAVPAARQAVERWLGLSAGLPPQKHLAVLPFVNVGGEPANQPFCDGLTHSLTSQLTQLEQFHGALLVVPATDIYREDVRSVEEARRKFNVTLVLTGSLQRTGDRLLVNANLVDASTLRQRRAFSLEASAPDLLLLQEGLTRRVAGLLELELQPAGETVLASGRTAIPQAFDYYLQGRGYLQRYENPENIDLAIDLFQRALRLDPDYALAHAGLGEGYLLKYQTLKEKQWVERSRQACQQALELDSALPQPFVCLGSLDNETGDYERALERFQLALQVDPASDDAYRGLALAYERLGKLAQAEDTYRRAIELRPNYWAGYNWLGAFYFKHARYPEAVEMMQQAIALTPDNERAYSNLGGVYHLLGRTEEAIAALQKSLALRPNYRAYNNLATISFDTGRYHDAARLYEKALEFDDRDFRLWGNLAACYRWTPGLEVKAPPAYRQAIARAERALEVNPRDPTLLSILAEYYAELGDQARALDLINRALQAGPTEAEIFFTAGMVYENLGQRDHALDLLRRAFQRGYPVAEAAHHPALAALRQDPRFQELLNQIR